MRTPLIKNSRIFQLVAIGLLAIADYLLLMGAMPFVSIPPVMVLPLQIVMFCLITSFIRHCYIEVSP